MTTVRFALLLAASCAVISACGPGTAPPPAANGTLSQSFSAAGYSGTLSLANVTEGAGASASLSASTTPPSGVSVSASAARAAVARAPMSVAPSSVLLYLDVTFSAAVTAGSGTLTITAPSGVLSAADTYELALYGPPGPAWQDGYAGPAAVAGGTLTFALPAPVAFDANTTYTIALYAVSGTASPAPSPAISPSPSESAAPLTLNASSIGFTLTGATQTVQVEEVGYTGSFGETNTCGTSSPVATFAASTGQGPTWNAAITSANAGSCTVTFTDGNRQSASAAITVTISGFVIQSVGRNR